MTPPLRRPKNTICQAPPRHSTPLHSTSPPPPRHRCAPPLRRPATPLHSTLEVAPENPRHATHFIKENENGLANKLRGPSPSPQRQRCNCARVCLGPALVEVSEGGPAARGTIHFGIVWRETLFRAM